MSEEFVVEDGRTAEKAALVAKEDSDVEGEIYSTAACWKARSFKLAVVVSVVALVLVALLVIGLATGLAVSSARRSSENDRVITLEDVFDPNFQVHTFQGTWAGDRLVYLDAGSVMLYNPEDNSNTTLIDSSEVEHLGTLSAVLPSPPLEPGVFEKILLAVNRTSVYRHSTLADYFIYDTPTKKIIELVKPEGADSYRFQYVAWSPNAQYIAYVLNYNVYLVELHIDVIRVTALTSDGSEGGVTYGIPDWVYEEEVFSSDHTLWWSPDSFKILIASFDDSEVETYSFPKYGDPEQQYDTLETIPYPKPGTVNPFASLYVVDILAYTNFTLLPGSPFNDRYLAYAGWVDDTRPYAGWLNRTQTYIEFCWYTDGSSDCNLIYSYEVPGQWVEQYSSSAVRMVPSSANSSQATLYTLLSQPIEDDAFTHLAAVESTGTTFLTGFGKWVVNDIVGLYKSEIFYLSSEAGVFRQHLYSYSSLSQNSVCLTCNQEDWGIPSSPNVALPESCDYFQASCDDQLQFCLIHCIGPRMPYSIMVRYNEELRQLEAINLLEPNTQLGISVSDVNLPTVTTFTVPSSEEGPELVGKLTLPPNFSSGNMYPVLVHVYGGPNFQVVSDSCILNSLSNLFYVSNLSLILASVDGRGTGGRGDNYKFSVYKNLGHLETIDQLRAGRYLSTLGYIDGSRLAIYGSSYGGYMAGNVGSSGSGIFKTAISQSPVSDWLYYDSIYTERYMIKPNDNTDGYQSSSILSRASNLQDVDFLLIHGTGDDNVHYQHTAQLAEALTQADVQFRMQVYTDKAHSLTGGNTRRHLYQLIADFLSESFKT